MSNVGRDILLLVLITYACAVTSAARRYITTCDIATSEEYSAVNAHYTRMGRSREHCLLRPTSDALSRSYPEESLRGSGMIEMISRAYNTWT